MNRTFKLALAATAAAGVAVATLALADRGFAPQSPAFDAGVRLAPTPPETPRSRTLAPQSNVPLGPPSPFGFNPGDCPTEDSCIPPSLDYQGGRWVIVPAIPQVP